MSTALGGHPARTSATRRFDAAFVLAKLATAASVGNPGAIHRARLEGSVLLRRTRMPDDIVIAGLLHDSVERGDVLLEEIEARFGERVARAVAALTEDDGIDAYEARKAALRDQVATAGPEAAAVFAADKVSSARNVRRVVNGGGHGLEHMAPDLRRKFAHYEQSLVMLERLVPRLDLVRDLRQAAHRAGSRAAAARHSRDPASLVLHAEVADGLTSSASRARRAR